jgi:ribosome recycling factor
MSEIISRASKEAEARMHKAIEALKAGLDKIRTGRANPALLEHVMVDYYGSRTPLNQVANVSVGDARTLTVTPWDKGMVQAIEKAIAESGLGLNPAAAGQTIRVPMPVLTEERRKDLGKVVRTEGEAAKVAVRNARRDANNALKESLKKKEFSEDEEKRAQDAIQKLTDRYVADVDRLVDAKAKDLLAI